MEFIPADEITKALEKLILADVTKKHLLRLFTS